MQCKAGHVQDDNGEPTTYFCIHDRGHEGDHKDIHGKRFENTAGRYRWVAHHPYLMENYPRLSSQLEDIADEVEP